MAQQHTGDGHGRIGPLTYEVLMAKKSRSQPPPGTPKVSVAPATPDGPNRKVRKEEARKQREAIQRKAGRRKLYRWGVAGVIVVAVAIAGTAVALNQKSSPSSTSSPPATLAGMQHTQAPWTNGLPGLKERLDAIGLPALSQEALAFHIHMLLQVYVDGKPVAVPQGIGINNVGAPADQFITVLHTHDPTGVIHVESPTQTNYTLGEFFNVWGVPFSSSQLGAYSNSGDTQIRVFLNGKPYTADPTGLLLKQHEDIVVTYGTEKQLPKPIPSTYSGSISTSCAPGC
jgi:hypothetical protein